MSMLLALQLFASSILGPSVLCACWDGCVTIEVEPAECCAADEGCPGERDAAIAVGGSPCCEWCVTVSGDGTPKLVWRGPETQPSKSAAAAVGPVFAPWRACDRSRLDRTRTVTGPPPTIAHLRTVCLQV